MLHETSDPGPRAGAKFPAPIKMPPAIKMPPRMAIWLIATWGSRRYRGDLIGDLIEQHRTGRSRAWCWRQAAWALWLARVEAWRTAPWMAAIKALLVAFGVLTLGVSTLSWAESVHDDTCEAASCGAVAPTVPGR